MEIPSNFSLVGVFIFVILFASTLTMLHLGRRIGVQRRALDPEGAAAGLGTVEGAVFGLMGLLLAFTFSGAASRFEVRRQLIVEETNAIGTAYLRLDLLPPGDQPKMREDFRSYVDARLSVYRKLPDLEASRAEMSKATALQGQIWSRGVAGCKELNSPAVTSLVLSSLNAMIDITTTRSVALRSHPPAIIFAMLFVLLLASSLLAGYSMSAGKARSSLHMVGFALIMAIAVYIIIDIEFPRVGLVRIDYVDGPLTRAVHLVSRVRGEEELEGNELIRKRPSGETSYCKKA
jgi:hypothetical protein